MEWYLTLLIIVGGLLVLMATGLPIAFCFLGINLIGAYVFWGGAIGLEQLSNSIFGTLATFILSSIAPIHLYGRIDRPI